MDEVGTASLRHLYQDHLSLRAEREDKRPVTGVNGQKRTEARKSSRALMSPFGNVVVQRLAITKHVVSGGLRPMDAQLSLACDSSQRMVRRDIS
jgi:hypothetical protein